MASEDSAIGSSSNGGLEEAQSAKAEQMNAHPNMHFDTQAGKWMFEDAETGQEYEWNTTANAWLPVMDEEMLEAQQKAYSVQGVDETAPTTGLLARDRKKKRKADGTNGVEIPNKKPAKQKLPPRNTAVYLQHLPLDATIEEVSSAFSKAGLILLDADGQPKIKLYTDSSKGERNGEGLVVYYKEESVDLAVNLLDDSPLRLGDKESMKVSKADWAHKTTQEAGDGSKVDAPPARRKAKTDAIKQKMQRRAEKLQREAADYDPSYDEQDSPIVATASTSKSAGGRVAVLAHVFTLDEIKEDASLLLDLKEEVRDECENIGRVSNVVLYDKEPDGIVTIKFAEDIAAQACVIKNNNRFFGGRQLKAWIYNGKTRYRKSGTSDSAVLDGENPEDAEKRRLEEFGKWLEEDGA